ncbi:TRAFAC clade GTPase domain-containing protein [Sutcliffiella halmapala]
MRRSFEKVFLALNILLLVPGLAYWTTDIDSLSFKFLMGISGTLLFLALGLYTTRPIFTILGYSAFIWAFWPAIYYIATGDVSEGSYIYLALLIVFVVFIKAPPAFLSGFMYSFMSFYLYHMIAFFLEADIPFSLEAFQDIDLITYGIVQHFWIHVAVGYVVSVVPYYFSKTSSDEPRFHFIGLIPVFFLTLPVQVGTGVMWGLYRAMMNYKSMLLMYASKQTETEARRNVQPAYQIYWMKKAFHDIRSVYRHTVEANTFSMKKFIQRSNRLKSIYGFSLGLIPYVTMRISAYTALLIGYLFLVCCSILHFLVCGVISLGTYLYLGVFYILDQFRLKSKKIETVCPSCYHKSELPDYVCYGCGVSHTNLRPGLFGVRKRKCQCGQVLPATYYTQRQQLEAKCKGCQKTLRVKEATPFCVSVIGSPSSGKTTFVTSMIRNLQEGVAAESGFEADFLYEEEKLKHEQHVVGMRQGSFPMKTINNKPLAMNIKLSSKKWRNDKLLYIYDPAGEAYNNTKELALHHYYSYLNGLVLIIDPFAMPDLAEAYKEQLTDDPAIANRARDLLDDTFDKLMVHLSKNMGIKETKKLNIPIAIVINKVDAYGLDEMISSREVSAASAEPGTNTVNESCKSFLSSMGYQFFVKQVESKFSNHQYFYSTSLSQATSKNKHNSADPIIWLLKQNKAIS